MTVPKVSPVLAVEAECTFISRPVLPIALPLVTSAPEPALPAASILRAIFPLLVIIAWVVALASYTLNCWKRSRPVQYIAGGDVVGDWPFGQRVQVLVRRGR